MVTVGIDIVPCVLERLDKVFAPEEEAVSDKSTDLSTKLSIQRTCSVVMDQILTAALATNMEYAKVPVILGIPYVSKAA